MDVLMDGLLMAASLFAGGYCWVLARRVRDLKSLDKGLGGAIVTLTRQIELARGTLEEAKSAAKDAHDDLSDLISQADSASGQLKLSLAAAKLAGVERSAQRPAHNEGPPVAEPSGRPAPAASVPPPANDSVPHPQPAEPRKLADIASLFAGEIQADQTETSQPEDGADAIAGLPKPRALPPISNPLRRREPIAPVRSEDELMDFLTSMAAGGAR